MSAQFSISIFYPILLLINLIIALPVIEFNTARPNNPAKIYREILLTFFAPNFHTQILSSTTIINTENNSTKRYPPNIAPLIPDVDINTKPKILTKINIIPTTKKK